MPHASLTLEPGADVNETPALNSAGFSVTNLTRFMYDRHGIGLIQKIGGWTRFYGSATAAIVRALWAWSDTNAVTHLAFGTQQIGSTGSSQLGVITSGALADITPQSTTDNVTPAASATSGSATVVITDATTTGISSYNSVYIETHMSVGGIVLFGLYPTQQVGATTYNIFSTDIFGNLLPATSTIAVTTVALFATTSGTSVVQVTLNNHGYMVGSTYPALVSTTVGGVVIYGNYVVARVIDANNFTIQAAGNATLTTSGSINGGNVRFVYSFGVGAIPPGTGYGIGAYGSGGYGTGTGIIPTLGTAILANDWTLDNWGEILISCPINGTLFQPIYQWSPLSGSPIATVIPAAPPLNDGIFVAMPQRQIIAWGSTFTGIQDPLLIRWCDVNNYNVWIAQTINQAGSYRLTRGSKIVGALQGSQQGIVWTDVGVWTMQYVGQPYVYSFSEVGRGCGLIARKAAAWLGDTIYWMGPDQFYSMGGSGAQPLNCPVWDVIFQNIDPNNLSKIRTATNSLFNEVMWYYPSQNGAGEVDSYVKFNAVLNAWDYGSLARSAWIDQSVLGAPIGADPTSRYLYQHETSPDADGQPLLASFQTGYAAMNDGDVQTFVDQVWPDMRWGEYGSPPNATVNLTFYVADYPGQMPRTYGPYALTQATKFITPRFRGRLVSIGMGSSDVGSFWRIGRMRYRYAPDGAY